MVHSEQRRIDARDVPRWDVETDVLIVGYGCAGASAAIEAASAGSDVLVLERAGGAGGTSALSGGFLYLGGGTSLQKALGFEDDAESMFKYMMAACGPAPDESLIAPYCEECVAHFDWFVDKGVPFKKSFFEGAHEPFHSDCGLAYSGSEHVHPFNQIARPAPRGHIPQKVREKGALLMQCLIASAEKAGVQTQLQSRCDALVLESDGTVSGARVSTLEGERFVRARKGVILTAGGFIYNQDMLDRYAPRLATCRAKVGTENDDGSGILLGLAAGAEAIRMDAGDISLAIFPPNDLRRGLFVTGTGQRFLNEDVYMGRAGETVIMQQGGRAYLIVDEPAFQRPEFFPIELAGVAETIEELEAEVGFPRGALQTTVALYNEAAARGEDPVFHKLPQYVTPLVSPPFAAIDLSAENFPYPAFTLGGLRINARGEVLNAAGASIPGLYAAGRTTSGVAKQGYSSGMSLGDGSFFGRRAGRNAAARKR
jgi:3-oxo-5alpha-steroid 4-dehydrogenase